MTTGFPNLHAWQAAAPALGLKRQRHGELVGPCPACGGTDRFRVTAKGSAFCRQCCPDGKNPEAFRRLIEAAGFTWPKAPETRPGSRRTAFQPAVGDRPPEDRFARHAPPDGDSRGPGGQPHGRPDASSAKIDLARRLWAATVADPGAVAAYVAGRGCWPPDEPLPAAVRWLPGLALTATRWREGPPGSTAGAMACAFTAAGEIRAVSLEALRADGRRCGPRWRRTIGVRAGALFDAGGDGPAVVLAEGEVSAMACRWLHPDARCFAAGGSAGLAAIRPSMLPADGPVTIEADGDRPGRDAARAARHNLPGARVTWRRDGDPADELAGDVGERTAILAIDGGLPDDEAMAAAWRIVCNDERQA